MNTNISTIRRNLSGIYIFDTLPQDERRQPTCIEDCNENTRMTWLRGLDIEALRRTGQHLNECMASLQTLLTDDERRRIDALTLGHTTCVTSYALHEDLVSEINRFCRLLRVIADIADISARGSEADRRQKEEEEVAQ